MNETSNTLYIRLPVTEDLPVCWYLSDQEQGELTVSEMSQLKELNGVRSVVTLVPGEQVTLLEIPFTGALNASVKRSLPYRIEDELASDVEEVHVAVLNHDEQQGIIHTAIVENTMMKRWLEWCHRACIVPDLMLPETTALEWRDGISVFERNDGNLIVRTGQYDGVVCDPCWFELYIEQTGLEHNNNVFLNKDKTYWDLLITEQKKIYNLLQGCWKPVKKATIAATVWQQSKLTSICLTLAFAFWVVSTLIDTWNTNEVIDQHRTETNRIFAQAMPGKRPVRPRSQLSRELASLKHNSQTRQGFTQELDFIASVLLKHSPMSIHSIQYEDSRNQLRLVAEAGSINDFTQLRDEISASRSIRLESLEQKNAGQGVPKVSGILILSGEPS